MLQLLVMVAFAFAQLVLITFAALLIHNNFINNLFQITLVVALVYMLELIVQSI